MSTSKGGTTAIVVALIAALGGLGTAIVNRVSPSEPTATITYSETRRVVNEMYKELVRLDVRVGLMESRDGRRPKKNRKRARMELPKINVLQMRGPADETE